MEPVCNFLRLRREEPPLLVAQEVIDRDPSFLGHYHSCPILAFTTNLSSPALRLNASWRIICSLNLKFRLRRPHPSHLCSPSRRATRQQQSEAGSNSPARGLILIYVIYRYILSAKIENLLGQEPHLQGGQ